MVSINFIDNETVIPASWLNDVDNLVYDIFSNPADKATARTNLGVAIGSAVQAWDADLDALAALASTGIAVRTAADTWAQRSLAQPASGLTISNSDGIAGNPTFALANDLAALEGLASTGIAVRSAVDTWVQRSLTQPAAGITIANNDGVFGNPTFALANDLAAVEALAGTGGVERTGADTWATYALTTFAKNILDDADAATARGTLELSTVSQAEAEAGVATTTRAWTAQRVGQAIAALSIAGLDFLGSADASNDATIDFTAFDATKYDAYLFVLSNVVPATDGTNFFIRTSTDGGVGFDNGASDYQSNIAGRDNAEVVDTWKTAGTTSAQLQMTISVGMGSAAGEDGLSGRVLVLGPHLAKRTILVYEGSYIDSDGQFRSVWGQGMRNSAADVDAIRFIMDSGNIESGTITMYGLRNA